MKWSIKSGGRLPREALPICCDALEHRDGVMSQSPGTIVALAAGAWLLWSSVMAVQAGWDTGPAGAWTAGAARSTGEQRSATDGRFVLTGGRLDSSVLGYVASLATNAAFVGNSNKITRYADLQAFVGGAQRAITNLVSYFNENSLEIKEGTEGGSWYAFRGDPAQGLDYGYAFSSPTGVLLQASVRPPRPAWIAPLAPAPFGYQVRFFADGTLGAFVRDGEAMYFYPSGTPSRYYHVLQKAGSPSEDTTYFVNWDQSGHLARQGVQKPWSMFHRKIPPAGPSTALLRIRLGTNVVSPGSDLTLSASVENTTNSVIHILDTGQMADLALVLRDSAGRVHPLATGQGHDPAHLVSHTLAPGETYTCTLKMRVPTGFPPGQYAASAVYADVTTADHRTAHLVSNVVSIEVR
jgi:hypothetical protein